MGIAGKINEEDIDINAIKKSEITFFEGYLWDEGHPKKAFETAIKFSNKRVSQNVLKVLNSAIANAENIKQLDIDNLYIKHAYVGKG